MRRVLEIVFALLLPCVCWAADGSALADSLEEIPLYEMEGMTVTATRVPTKLENVPLGTEIIDRAEIESSGAADAGELLRTGVGINVRSYGYWGSVSSVSIRGSAASQVLVLLDGRPINSVVVGSADVGEISLWDIGRVEVVRGPISSLYGANALGGVVNIITTPTSTLRSLKGRAEFGSYGRETYSLSSTSYWTGLGVNLSGDWRGSDGDRENSDFESGRFSAKLAYSGIKWMDSEISAGVEGSRLGLPGPVPADGDTAKYGSNDVTSLFDRQKNNRMYVDVSGGFKWAEECTLSSKLYFEERDLDYHSVYESWDCARCVQDDEYITTVAGADFQFDWRPFSSAKLVLGMSSLSSTIDARDVILNDDTKELTETRWAREDTAIGVYVESEWSGSEDLVLIGSTRSDWSNAYGSRMSSSGGLVYRFMPNLRTKLSVGQAFRAPTLSDLYWPGAGNENLRPETGFGTELRFEHEPESALSVAISVFRRDVDDLIAWARFSDMEWRPMNVNEHRSSGAEIEFELKPSTDTRLKGNFLYLSAQQKDRGMPERRAAFLPKTKVSMSAFHKWPMGIGLLLRLQHTGDRVSYYGENLKTLEGALVADARLEFDLGPQHFSVKVDNIFDVQYAEQFGGGYKDGDYPSPGRTFSYGMEFALSQ